MFLKRNRRTKNGETYEYWSLVETGRTGRGPRHRLVANLGKLPGLDQKHRHGWENLATQLDEKPGAEHQTRRDLFGEGSQASEAAPDASPPHAPQWVEVDVRGLRVGRVRDFGQVYLALALWRRLGLHTLLEELLPKGRETVPWPLVASILAIARFCGNRSELEVAERWYRESALEDLLGVGWEQVYDNRLYRGLDCLVEQKDAICQPININPWNRI